MNISKKTFNLIFCFLLAGAFVISIFLSKVLGGIILIIAFISAMNVYDVSIVSLSGAGAFLAGYGLISFKPEEPVPSWITVGVGLLVYAFGMLRAGVFKKK